MFMYYQIACVCVGGLGGGVKIGSMQLLRVIFSFIFISIMNLLNNKLIFFSPCVSF